AETLQTFQQRRQRAVLQRELVAEGADSLVVLFPERSHHEILRIGQAELVEQGLVDAIEGVAGRIDGEAEEIVQLHRVESLGLRHQWAPDGSLLEIIAHDLTASVLIVAAGRPDRSCTRKSCTA